MFLKANRLYDRRRRARGGWVLASVMITCLCLAGLPGSASGQAKVGTTGAQFLELGVSARAMGMAEAFTALTDDLASVYYNPAGLTALYGREMMATHVQMPADVSYNFGAIGLPLEAIGGVLGISAYGLFSGDMIVRTYERGTMEGTGQTFSYNDFAVAFSYGRYLTDRFSIGLTFKWIGEFTHKYSSNGWSADVGTIYDTGFRNFKIAMVIMNFGPDMKFIETPYPLPINFKFGSCINVLEGGDHLLSVAAEGSHPSDNLEKYNAGLEYTYKERFTLRGGGRFNYDEDGLTAGGGLRLPFGEDQEIGFDYAFQDFGILNQIHRFTMRLAF